MAGGALPSSSTGSNNEPFVLRHHTRALMYCSFFVLGAVLYGYDGTYFTGIVAMREFLSRFGDATDSSGMPALKSGTLSLLSSIVQVGELVGSLSASVIGTIGGRRGGLVVACIFVSIGAIIQLAAEGSVAQLTVGRLVLGVGIGQISNCVPLYLSEASPTAIRGIVVGSWQLLLAIGQVIGACVDQGTKDISSTASYRIPIGLNFVIPLVVFLFIWFIPESPRWLVGRGKVDQARTNLARINQSNPDYVPEKDLDGYIQDDRDSRTEAGAGSWGSLSKDPVEFRKLVSTFGVLAGQQIGGVQFIFSYATVIATDLQLANPFLITIIIDIIEVLGVVAGFFVIERMGRKTLILWCSLVEIISMLIIGGLASGPQIAPTVPPEAYGQAAIAFICVYVFAFNMSWGPLAWSVATEMCVGPNRSKIMGVGTAAFWIVAWAVTFTLPYLYNAQGGAGLGLKIGYIYSGGCLLSALFIWLYIGETRGRSLEEINELFARRVPARKWKSYVLSPKDLVASKNGPPTPLEERGSPEHGDCKKSSSIHGEQEQIENA